MLGTNGLVMHLIPLTGRGAKNKVVIKRPILASLAASPVTYGGLGQLVR